MKLHIGGGVVLSHTTELPDHMHKSNISIANYLLQSSLNHPDEIASLPIEIQEIIEQLRSLEVFCDI